MNPLAFLAAQLWAMDANHLTGFRRQLASIAVMMKAGIGLNEKACRLFNGDRILEPTITNGVATVPVTGPLIANPPPWLALYGAITDLGELAAVLDDLTDDPTVTAITLAIDSPGGTVAGTAAAAAAVARARAAGKPCTASVSGLCASAAYWIACACDRIDATPDSLIGSIGVYSVLCDSSAADQADGLAFTVVGSGGIKGAGADGKVTDALVADTQRIIAGRAAQFTAHVAASRKLTPETAAGLSTGHVWFAAEAQAKGLIDAVTAHAATPTAPDDDGDECRTAGGTATQPTGAAAASVESQPTPSTTAPESRMKLTADQLVAIINDNPSHAKLISDRAKAGDDEAAIRSAITAADGKSKDEQITALNAAAKAKDDQIAKLTTDLAAMTKKHDALAALGGGAARDPGHGASGDASPAAGTGDDVATWKQEFNASAKIRDDFALGGVDSYIAFKRAESNKRK